MNAQAPPVSDQSPERRWWLRALAVFQSPRPVFAALRDESPREAEAREEPILAVIILAGIAAILLAPETGRLLDEDLVGDSIAVLAVLIFLTGAIYGVFAYWIGGGFLYIGLRGAGSRGSYRRARHILAFAAIPTVLGLLLVWPVQLVVYGADSFRSGGEDEGIGPLLFDLVEGAFVLWSLALLVYGIAVVERWRLLRGAVAVSLAVLAIFVLTFPFVLAASSS